jgi:hypothetical protein
MSSITHGRFTLPDDPAEIERLLGGAALLSNPPAPTSTPPVEENLGVRAGAGAGANQGTPATDSPFGRDAKGRFLKGNPGGPGNPFNRRVAALRKLLLDTVSDEKLVTLMDILYARAAGGDMAAMKLYLQYVIGKPAETVDPDRVELQEHEILCECKARAAKWGEILGSPDLEAVLWLTETLRQKTDLQFFKSILAPVEAKERAAAKRAAKRKAPTEASPRTAVRGLGTPTAAPAPTPTPPGGNKREVDGQPEASVGARARAGAGESAPRPSNGGNGRPPGGPAKKRSGKIDAKTLRAKTLAMGLKQAAPSPANGRNGRKRRR